MAVKYAGERFSITWQFTDAGQRDHMKLGNSVRPGLFAAQAPAHL